jgi:hypothetical protein
MRPTGKDAPFRIGEAVAYHRGDGVHRGVVLAHGRDGCRVVDATTGAVYVVVYDGIYRHLTVPGDALRPAVVALHALGIPVHLSDEQRAALEES